MPEISIVLPVYNGQRYLPEALESIINQSFKDFELIVVNDCSTDSTEQIVQKYMAQDSRIRLHTNESNLRLPRSLNAGFKMASGKYHTWTSDDNNLHSNCLFELHRALLESQVDIVFSDYNVIDESSRLCYHSNVGPEDALIHTNTIGASFLYRKEVTEELNGYNSDLFLIEDYDFWVRARLKGFRYLRLPYSLYDYRIHGSSLSSTRKLAPTLAPYLYEIRTKFSAVEKAHAFRSRTALLYYGKDVLTFSQLLTVFAEAMKISPIGTLKLMLTKGKKMLIGLFSKGNQ